MFSQVAFPWEFTISDTWGTLSLSNNLPETEFVFRGKVQLLLHARLCAAHGGGMVAASFFPWG